MAGSVRMSAVGLHENIETLLAGVESCMLSVLQLNTRSEPSVHADSRTAAAYHLRAGGRRVRARLALSAGLALGLSKADSICIASCAELLHNASLIHDDIQDRDDYRRGQPAVWTLYGSNLAICTGDFLLSAAYGVLCTFSQPLILPSMLALLHERTGNAIDGQCADLAQLAGQSDKVAAYIQIATAKSGALLSLPLELALLAAGHSNALNIARQACENLAVSYQILDDLQDLQTDGGRIGDGVDQPVSLNIVAVLCHVNGLARAVTEAEMAGSARELGLQYLAFCDLNAVQMPKKTGEILLELSADLRRMLNAHECLEAH